ADAACRATVLQVSSFRTEDDGVIRTRTLLRVDEVFKGTLPPVLRVVHDGGQVGDEGAHNGFAPEFRPGEERLLFLARRVDGSVAALNGFASSLKLGGTPGIAATLNSHALTEARQAAGKAGGPLAGADLRDQAGEWTGPVPGAPVTAQNTTGL
ncbi:MAG TPA: hypothetical protein DCY13_06930, partial [Verrucomicrobiales bacterium]|nr:hypothetical protein [Verrucomicrobiales bacterium]